MSVMAFDRPGISCARRKSSLFERFRGANSSTQHAPEERVAKWRRDKIVEREMWREAGAAGLLCLAIPESLWRGGRRLSA